MAFLNSGAAIYNTMKHEGALLSWVKEDYNSLLMPLLNQGFVWDANTEKLKIPTNTDMRKLIYGTPWCHAKGTPRKNCGLDHQVTFNNFHIIHPRCMSCWKVVVTPKTFKQLCQLEILEKNMDVPSKCGIEMRDYTPKFYGGYFYTHSLEEGRERYEQVRKAVNEEIDSGKDLDVILKRGCTEYEMIKGPSVYWNNDRGEEEMLEIIDAFVEIPRSHNRQSEMVKTNVRLKWVLWAHSIGDFTYKELNNGQSLFPDYVKYHEGDIEGLKQDLAAAHAEARDKIPMEKGVNRLKSINTFAGENDLKVDQISGLFKGTENVSYLDEVPEETKGDDDRLTS